MTFLLLATALGTLPCPAAAMDHIVFERDGRPQTVAGRILVEAQDGGLLVLDPSNTIWAITAEELVSRRHDAVAFEPHNHDALWRQLQEELPRGFRVHRTAHYLIGYNTTTAYAEWCGALFERLYRAFRNYWRERDLELTDPDWPLVALVFNSPQAYAAYADAELGEATASIIGYFSLRTNRVTMYDLTGADGQTARGRSSSVAHINRILSQPGAERTVATIIHEATHQLAFNCGLQTRYADIPLWVSEGIAIYFETPDLGSSKAWRTIGGVNRVRNLEFRRYLPNRTADSLRTLLASDERFRNSRTAPDAYAEAWALSYYLLRTRPKQYVEYMRILSQKKPLLYDQPEERLAEFRDVFGEDLDRLDALFLRYMRGVR